MGDAAAPDPVARARAAAAALRSGGGAADAGRPTSTFGTGERLRVASERAVPPPTAAVTSTQHGMLVPACARGRQAGRDM
jgi:hypothetical protein